MSTSDQVIRMMDVGSERGVVPCCCHVVVPGLNIESERIPIRQLWMLLAGLSAEGHEAEVIIKNPHYPPPAEDEEDEDEEEEEEIELSQSSKASCATTVVA